METNTHNAARRTGWPVRIRLGSTQLEVMEDCHGWMSDLDAQDWVAEGYANEPLEVYDTDGSYLVLANRQQALAALVAIEQDYGDDEVAWMRSKSDMQRMIDGDAHRSRQAVSARKLYRRIVAALNETWTSDLIR